MIQKLQNNSWLVLQTRSRHEKKVLALLTRLDIEVFLPLHVCEKQWSDRIKLVEEPLFPGYLFVKYDEVYQFQVLNTPGSVRFVSFEGNYATIQEKQIEAIKAIVSLGENPEVVDLTFDRGEEVFISNGPFKGIYAKLVDYKGKGKLLLEVEAIGKGVLLEIGKTKIEKVKQ